jgi:hypothetical protein
MRCRGSRSWAAGRVGRCGLPRTAGPRRGVGPPVLARASPAGPSGAGSLTPLANQRSQPGKRTAERFQNPRMTGVYIGSVTRTRARADGLERASYFGLSAPCMRSSSAFMARPEPCRARCGGRRGPAIPMGLVRVLQRPGWKSLVGSGAARSRLTARGVGEGGAPRRPTRGSQPPGPRSAPIEPWSGPTETLRRDPRDPSRRGILVWRERRVRADVATCEATQQVRRSALGDRCSAVDD